MSTEAQRRFRSALLAERVDGRAAVAVGVVWVGVGATFAFVFSLSKFTDHASEVRDFTRFGVPAPAVSTYLAGSIEFVGGVLLLAGLLTRLAALLLAADMVGAILTAGRNVGGVFHLGLAPALLALMMALLVTGGGAFAADKLLAVRIQAS